MTERTNRFSPIAGKAAVSREEGFEQLQDHCDRLNAMDKNGNATTRWMVVGEYPNRTVAPVRIDRREENALAWKAAQEAIARFGRQRGHPNN